jgi:hypothetical protein
VASKRIKNQKMKRRRYPNKEKIFEQGELIVGVNKKPLLNRID